MSAKFVYHIYYDVLILGYILFAIWDSDRKHVPHGNNGKMYAKIYLINEIQENWHYLLQTAGINFESFMIKKGEILLNPFQNPIDKSQD